MLFHPVQLVLLSLACISFLSHQAVVETTLVRAQNVQEQDREENPECAAALQNAQNKIKQGRDVNFVGEIEKTDVSQEYADYPKDRPSGYSFIFSGSAAESVLYSPKLLTSISTDIIKKCDSVSVVEFGLYPSDWIVTFGLMEQGKVKEFTQCGGYAGGNIPSRIPWGSIVCI